MQTKFPLICFKKTKTKTLVDMCIALTITSFCKYRVFTSMDFN